MNTQPDPRQNVLRTIELPNIDALFEVMRACIALQLVFDVRLRQYDIRDGAIYPRFTLIVFDNPIKS